MTTIDSQVSSCLVSWVGFKKFATIARQAEQKMLNRPRNAMARCAMVTCLPFNLTSTSVMAVDHRLCRPVHDYTAPRKRA